MVWATSLPYAPTFWIGVPPTRPGMPDRASIPLHSCSTAVATRASQSSPAATVTVAPLQSETSAVMPRVATRTTVPGNPWSAISRFEPPPSTSTGSPAASAARTASTSSVSVVAVTTARAGPPTRSVVQLAPGRRRCCGRQSGVGTVEVSDSEVTSQDSPAVTEMSVTTCSGDHGPGRDRQAQSTTARAAPSTLTSPLTASMAIVTRASSTASTTPPKTSSVPSASSGTTTGLVNRTK